jgi:hypothetical protein
MRLGLFPFYLSLRAGIRDGRKRVKLATAMFAKEQMKSCNPVSG